MRTTRRDLLRLGLGGSTLLACGTTVPTFLARSVRALSEATRPDADGRILVIVQLDGGNDGLNTVVPFADDLYHSNRPRLALKAESLKRIDDHVGFHPSLDPFAKLLEDQKLAIVQSVGYPNPNRSHFESMAIWQTARLEPGIEMTGWLARALDSGPDHPGGDAPALHIADGELPQALRGGRRHVPSVADAAQFHRRLGIAEADGAADQRAALDRIVATGSSNDNPLIPFIARSTLASYTSSTRIEQALHDEANPARYPESDLARQLRLIARLIRAGLATPIYYTQLDGFDTHAEQLNQHANLLSQLGRSLRAFLDDLDASGESDRVLVLVFSEFGRRLRENASEGTDHGTAAPVFVLGRSVEPGLHGPYPDLNDLEDGDPRFQIDFRRIYAGLLNRWLDLPWPVALGGDVIPLALTRT